MMAEVQTVAVIDIGKTNLKLALVDLARGEEIAVETAPNRVRSGPPWPHFDTGAQWDFLSAAMARLAARHRIDGIAVTTHGACAALLDADGDLAAPVMDYEFTGPDSLRAEYDHIRPPFAETGSPALPMGLNLGAQLHYALHTDPDLAARITHVLTWPQYWGFRLTGQVACDLSSLGCHTDLWNPLARDWSSLPAALGLAGKMAPARRPDAVLGSLTPALQAAWGLGPVPVVVGIHDSNASLLPHLKGREAPFAVVSTGTWVICMAIGGASVTLDPSRDTLINVDTYGNSVPSSRFMGGRENEILRAGSAAEGSPADAAEVLDKGIMHLPAVVQDSGPFPGRSHRWTTRPQTEGQGAVAVGYYLGLMTGECLRLIGAAGPILVEGPFSGNRWFLAMLASATGRVVIPSAARTGTALGAALLFAMPSAPPQKEGPISPDPRLKGYAMAWQAIVRRMS